jgi:HD-GYP domain-containing protein (c-di-GMP phosphodiesterase class II)
VKPSPVRLVELLGTLSLACDAADGFAHSTTMRSALLAAALAREVGGERLVADVLVGALLRHIGCTAFAVEEAYRYGAGDDVGLRHVMAEVDFGRPEVAVPLIGERLAAHAAPAARAEAVAALLGDGPVAGARHDAAQCDAAERLARLLPVSAAAARVASDAFERWDGRGGPAGRAGEAISLVARIVEVAYVAELFRSRQGRGGAEAELRARAGGQLDPELAARFLAQAGVLFDAVDDRRQPVWEQLAAAEPAPHACLSEAQADDVALAFARFTDLKSAWFTGHSEDVAALAAAAGAQMGLADARCTALRRAGLLHDIGRVGVPTGLWDLPRALGAQERDRVRFHAWETERVLGATPLFGTVARIAAAAHERADGSGYHRGHVSEDVADEAAVLAAADQWCALRAERAQRAAFTAEAARDELAAAVRERRMQRRAVEAVLAAAQQAPLGSEAVPAWPAGLTEREVEVLRLLAHGSSDKRIAADLGITAKTVAHHVQHVYDKIGVRSRAGAALFALEQRLVR